MPFSSRLASVLVMSLSLCAPLFGRADADYKVVQKVTVGGDGGWDYLTEENAEASIGLLPELLRRLVGLRNDVRTMV